MSGPQLTGRRITLRPADEHHSHFLRSLATGELTGYLWRLRGAVPSPGEAEQGVWASVLAQFVVVPNDEPTRLLGVSQLSNASYKHRYVYFSMALEPSAQRLGWTLETVVLTVNYAFHLWDFRKVYAELSDDSYSQIASGAGKLFDHEARLKEHEYVAGRYQDTHIISVTRQNWQTTRAKKFGLHSSP